MMTWHPTWVSAVSAVLLLGSALFLVCCREARWGILANWFNAVGASALLLDSGSELLAIVLLITSSLSAIGYFFHADALESVDRDAPVSWQQRVASLAFPVLVSLGLGWMVIVLLREVTTATLIGREQVSVAKEFLNDEVFVATQLVALLALAAVLGSGVIARSRATRTPHARQHSQEASHD